MLVVVCRLLFVIFSVAVCCALFVFCSLLCAACGVLCVVCFRSGCCVLCVGGCLLCVVCSVGVFFIRVFFCWFVVCSRLRVVLCVVFVS